MGRPVGARIVCRLDWNGEALDRLIDADHAAVVEAVVRLVEAAAWSCATEVSFNIAAERGSIDVLAWHPRTNALLVVEAKSAIPDVQSMLFTLDRKVRIATRLAVERGWIASAASRLLVVRQDRTTRRRVSTHSAIFGNAFPDRTVAVRRWIGAGGDERTLRGLMFLSGDIHPIGRHRILRARTAPVHGLGPKP